VGARADVAHGLRPDDRSGRETRRSRRLRELLVAWQLALALIMVTGAGLLGRSLTRLQHTNLGLRPEHLGFFALSLPAARYNSQDRVNALGDALFPRLREVPGVVAVTPVLIPPFFAPTAFQMHFEAEGETPSNAAHDASVGFEAVGPEYFRALGIPILRGRTFSGSGSKDAPLLEVVISESVARRYWPGRDPIGRRTLGGPNAPSYTVVGMVPDIHYRELRAGAPTVFLPWRQIFWQGNVAIRTSGDFATLLPAIRRVVHDLDPDVVLWQPATMDQLMAGLLAGPRASALLMSAFGMVALLLAAIGLYGVMASVVRQQTREIGIRMALGATPSQLRRAVLARSLQVLAIGTLLGLAGAFASVRLYRALLFEVGANDPFAFGGAIGLLLVIGLAAAFLPAHRATMVDPVQALRLE
jgi:predicted permease